MARDHMDCVNREPFDHLIDTFADKINHEACDYTIKATSEEIAEHLIFVNSGDRSACQRKRGCGATMAALYCTRERGHYGLHMDEMRYERPVQWF